MPRRKAAPPEPSTPWTASERALPDETGLYLCLCQYPCRGDSPDSILFPEILAFKPDAEGVLSFRASPHLRIRYWMPIPPCPQEPFDGIF